MRRGQSSVMHNLFNVLCMRPLLRRIGVCALKDMGRALSTGGAQHVRGE